MGLAGSAKPETKAQDMGLLQNIGEFLSRPLWAITSALTGDFEGAARNVGQFALDIPTGGFFDRRLSLGNIFSETGEITKRSQEQEVSEVLRQYGHRPSSTFERVATDIIGGVALDPTTYLTFAAPALAGKLSKALSAMSRNRAGLHFAEKLGKTAAGAALLEKHTQPLLYRLHASPNPVTASMERAVTVHAAEKALGEAAGVQGFRFGRVAAEEVTHAGPLPRGHRHQPKSMVPTEYAEEMDRGLKQLESMNALDQGGWKWAGIDLGGAGANPSKLLYHMSAPGLAVRGLRALDATKPAADIIEGFAQDGMRRVAANFFDKTLLGKVPESLRNTARYLSAKLTGADRTAGIRITKDVWKGWDLEQRTAMGKLYAAASDEFDTAMQVTGANAAAEETRIFDELVRTGAGATRKPEQHVRETLEKYRKDMDGVRDDLVKRGIWKHRIDTPFYMPRQSTFAKTHRDVYKQGRRHTTLPEFERSLERVAEDMGYDLADLGDLPEYNMADVHLRRLTAHNNTVYRNDMLKAAKQIGGGKPVKKQGKWRPLREGNNVDRYLAAQFSSLPERGVTKLLGGGTFTIPIYSDSVRAWAKKKGHKIRKNKDTGEETFAWKFKGLHYLIKPPLTTMPFNPSYFVRNHIGAGIMSLFDPDTRVSAKAFLQAVPYSNLIRKLTGLGDFDTPNKTALFVRAAYGDKGASAKLLGHRVGQWDASEITEHLRMIVGDSTNQADLMLKSDDLAKMRTGNPYDKMVALGNDIADHTESTLRADSFLTLVKKGVEPGEAFTRVQRAFVNYDRQSNVERAVRDIFPFARFTIGSLGWVGEMAKRPGGTGVTALSRITAGQAGDEALPPEVQGSIAIPAGEDAQGNKLFLSSLGMPHESTANILSAIPTPGRGFEGLRRNVLGMLAPPIRSALEATTGKNFFFGSDYGSYRKTPEWAAQMGLGRETPSGRREWSGIVNEVISATPASRASGTLDKLTHALVNRKDAWHRVVQVTTGARFRTVNAERAAIEALSDVIKKYATSGEAGMLERFYLRMDPAEAPPELVEALKEIKRLEKARRKK